MTEDNEKAKDKWKNNLKYLESAITHISKDGKLWKKIKPLLPSDRPTPKEGEWVPGLEVILIVRQFISKYEKHARPLDAFWQIEASDMFKNTFKQEMSLANRNNRKPLGYADDGFQYNGKIMRGKPDLQIPRVFCCIEDYDPAITTGWYINGVDHFFTNLIWLVVSGYVKGPGDRSEDAFEKARAKHKNNALHCSFKDCGIENPL